MSSINDDLVTAAHYGMTDLVILLLQNGACVHYGNNSALILAADNGKKHTIKTLIEYGANLQYAIAFATLNHNTRVLSSLEKYL